MSEHGGGGAITVTEMVATLGAKINRGEWKDVQAAIELLFGALEHAFHAVEGAVEKVIEPIREVAAEGDDIQTLSDQLGIATGALQELSGAAVLADANSESLTTGLRTLARTAFDAAQGGGEAADALAGITLKDSAGQLRSLEGIFTDFSEKIRKTTSHTEQLALAQKVLGRGGRELLPMLQLGAAGIASLREEVRESGEVLSEEAVHAGAAWDDAQKKLTASLHGLRNIYASPAAIEAFTHIYDALRKIASTTAARDLFAALGSAVTVVLRGVAALAEAFATWLGEHPEALLNALRMAALVLGVALTDLALTSLPAIASALAAGLPAILGWAAGLGALYLVADDLRAFQEGGDSLIGRIKKWLEVPVERTGLAGLLQDLFQALTGKLPADSWIYAVDDIIASIQHRLEGLQPVIDYLAGKPTTRMADLGIGGFVGTVRAGETPAEAATRLGGTYSGPDANVRRPANINSSVIVNVAAGTDAPGVATAVTDAMNSWWHEQVDATGVSLEGVAAP